MVVHVLSDLFWTLIDLYLTPHFQKVPLKEKNGNDLCYKIIFIFVFS